MHRIYEFYLFAVNFLWNQANFTRLLLKSGVPVKKRGICLEGTWEDFLEINKKFLKNV